MNRKYMCILWLLCLIKVSSMQAQTFDQLWNQVHQAQKKGLPASVVQLTSDIYQKGMKEKNSPQMLKAFMWRMKFREITTPDSYYDSVQEMEQWLKKTSKPTERAVLHSLLAGVYADYASTHQWRLRQRTNMLTDSTATDMRTWSMLQFTEKVETYTQAALKDKEKLLQTSSRTYIPLVVLGATSEYYHHDMYHLLATRGVESLTQVAGWTENNTVSQDIETIYLDMLSTYLARGDKGGYVLSSLQYLQWKYTSPPNVLSFRLKAGLLGRAQDPYLAELDQLMTDYRLLDVCAEVYLAKADRAMRYGQQSAVLKLCDEAIRLYPNYPRVNALKNLREQVLISGLDVRLDNGAFPGEEMTLFVSYKNLDRFTLQLYQGEKCVQEQHYTLPRSEEYRTQDTVFTFKAPAPGSYTVRIVSDIRSKEKKKQAFYVTRFKVLTCGLPNGKNEILVLDAETGHPVPNVQVQLFDNTQKVLQRTLTTQANGKVTFVWNSSYRYLQVSKGTDTASPKQFLNNYGYVADHEDVNDRLELFTDRSLYRPGQTVHVKGIAYTKESSSAHVIPNKEYTVVLKDVNGQEVGKKIVHTNAFGSFATQFTLPTVCLNGTFSLRAAGQRASIQVEEYKRPTFNITFEKLQGGYQVGDTVQVKGHAQTYSGVWLQNLPVKYTVRRSSFWLWRLVENVLVASGETLLNAEGAFTLPVPLKEDATYRADPNCYFRYLIEATVTNVSGETQSSIETITAGNRSLVMQTQLKAETLKDQPVPLTVEVKNLEGQPVVADGTYQLYRMPNLTDSLSKETPVLQGTFVANKEMQLDWKHLPSGAYLLKTLLRDEQGREVTAEARTLLFSPNDPHLPANIPLWTYGEQTHFDETHPAVFYVGTSEKDSYILLYLFSDKKMVESKVLNLTDSIVRFELPYQASYGDGITVSLCMVRNGVIHQKQISLEKRLPDTQLSLKWDVFRDKLRPGQEEEWRLTIRTPQGTPADAEMLAMMYDASLDKLGNRRQDFHLYYRRLLPRFSWTSRYKQVIYFNYGWRDEFFKVPELVYDHFMTGPDEGTRVEVRYMPVMASGAKMSRVANKQRSEEVQLSDEVPLNATMAQEQVTEDAEATVELRTNLAETAFFYPQLRTNEAGEVVLAFTMPQSLTRWNFRGYAHTKEMFMGTLNGEATTSKAFMLSPNLPRFVRVGDRTAIAAAITNTTGKAQTGTVTLTLFDPATEKNIHTQSQPFTVEAGQTIGVNFEFTADSQQAVLGCRMVADSGTFSDGEQQLIPVLSNQAHITETVPMPIRGEETRTFSLKHLFNNHSKTATHRRLTVECTGNPAWYAIQALPSLALPTGNDALSWATTYYANTLAAYIMNSQPRIKAVFDSWKAQGGTKETLLSRLTQNQELKTILLAESPWVLEAQTEQQQQERIATLFDLNTLRLQTVGALTKLKELQNADGAWSWYKGMGSSRYVTTYMAVLNARLALLTGQPLSADAQHLQDNALKYLHQSALDTYTHLRNTPKEGTKSVGVSQSTLQYLYLIALSGTTVPEPNKEAYRYYLSKINELLPSSSMDTKALAAIILRKAGRTQEAEAFIASLKEHLTANNEQGMYFAFLENPYTWGGMKLQAHVDAMEALSLWSGNEPTIEEMKFWLLKQKQTQQWSSPVATADAVYALLMSGVNLLDNRGDVKITLGKETLQTTGQAALPGLGYVKHAFTQDKVVDAPSIRVQKQSPGIAWGAVYAQYESPISDVKQQGDALRVEKRLYVERIVNQAVQLQPLTEQSVLNVGDRVVARLTIHTDRSMDFVQVSDQRAACLEPTESNSGYRWGNGMGYYQDTKDASTRFFFDQLNAGTYVLEQRYMVNRTGTYETGLTTIQCAYAPEYAGYATTMKLTVKGL